jgi:hypothetical protein
MGGCYSNNLLTLDIENSFQLVPYCQSRFEYGLLYKNLNPPYEHIMIVQLRQNPQFQLKLQKAQLLQQIVHPNIIRVFGFECFNQDGRNTDNCFTVENACLYFEYFLDSLETQIQNRIENNVT